MTPPDTRRPRRRWRRVALVVVLVAVVLRVALSLALPPVVASIGRSQGLAIEWEDLDLSLVTGRLRLWHLDVAFEDADEDDEPLAHLEYLLADVDVSALLTGALRVHRAEVDGLEVHAVRHADGAWNFERLASSEPEEDEETEPDEDDEAADEVEEPEPFDLGSPIEVRALRVQHVRLFMRDELVSPATEVELATSIRLSDWGHAERPAELRILAHAPELLDALRVDARVESGGPHLDARLDVAVAGLHPERARAWLEPLGITPVADALTFELAAAAAVEPGPSARGVDEDGEPLECHELTASVTVDGLELAADGEAAVALESITVPIPSLDHAGLEVGRALASGLRARATRKEDGALLVAGLELRPLPPAANEREPGSSEPSGEPADSTPGESSDESSGEPFGLALERLALEDVRVELHDEAVVPPTTIALELHELSLADIDSARPGDPLSSSVVLAADGLFDELRVTGSATPFADDVHVELDVALDGLAPERAAPYLAAAGIESTFEDGELRARLTADVRPAANGTTLSAELADVVLRDGEEWVELAQLGVDDVELANAGDVHVTGVELAGMRARLLRTADGVLHVAGLALGGVEPTARAEARAASSSPSEAVARAKPPDEPGTAEPPRTAVDSLVWRDTAIAWRDETLPEPFELSFDDVGLELEDLVLGGSPDAEPVPARLRFACAQPGLVESIELAGTITSRPGPLDVAVDLQLDGTGLQANAVRPYLDELGIESELADATLALALQATARDVDGGMEVSAALRDLAFTNQEREWIALEALEVPSVELANDGRVTIDRVAIVRPRTFLEREADGTLVVAGLRLRPAAPATAPETTAEPAAAPEDTGGTEDTEDKGGTSPADTPPAAATPPLELGRFELVEARIDWSDAAVEPGVATELRTSVELDDLVFPSRGDARFETRLALGDALGELTLAGTLRPDPSDVRVAADLDVRGLRPNQLAAYFPPGLSSTMEDGRAHLTLEAELADASEGGRRARVVVSDLTLRAGAESEAALALERLGLDVPRADAAAGVFEIADVAVEGLALATARETDGALTGLGFRFDPSVVPPAEPSEEPEPTPDATPAEGEADSIMDAPEAQAAAPRARATMPIPTVRLERLDVGIASLSFEDRSAEGAEPLDVALALSLPQATTLLAPDAEALEPLQLVLRGHARPIVETVELDLTAAPWRSEPELSLSCALRGLNGSGLTDVLPALHETLDGSGLAGGSLELETGAVVRWRRRSPLDFDVSNGFGLSADVSKLAYRAQPDGEVLAGIEALHVDVESIRPETGDVHVETIELDRPIGRLRQTAEGLHAGGLLFKAPPPSEDPEAPAEEEAPETEEPTNAPPAEPAPTPRSGGELRVDRLTVSGLDFEFVDSSVDPPLALPLDDLEVEVERFTTRALTEPVPIEFRASVYGGDIELPEREVGGSLLDVLGSAAGAIAGGSDEVELESRPLVDEVALNGRLTLVPQPKGWVKLSVAALELAGLRGPARAASVEIGDGLMNTDVEVRFRGENGMTADVDTSFAFLSLSEPPGGPISSYLKLPAPLDTVLFVLRNEDGEQVIPLSLSIGPDGLSITEITRVVTTTLTTTIADAIAASPFRIVGGALDLAGLGAKEPVELTDQTAVVEFEPAATLVRDEAWSATEALCAILRNDPTVMIVVQHEYGRTDLERIAELANPSRQECLALGQRLRQRKRDLEELRHDVAADVRAQLALGRLARADDDAEELRTIERDIGFVEEALDRVYELVRPGAERGDARRTRAAARSIAERRLESIRSTLERERIPRLRQRLDVRRPRYGEPTRAGGGCVTLTPKRR